MSMPEDDWSEKAKDFEMKIKDNIKKGKSYPIYRASLSTWSNMLWNGTIVQVLGSAYWSLWSPVLSMKIIEYISDTENYDKGLTNDAIWLISDSLI